MFEMFHFSSIKPNIDLTMKDFDMDNEEYEF